jgi:hypothetical protein
MLGYHSRLRKRNQKGNLRNYLSQKIDGHSRIRKDKPPVNQLQLTGYLKDNQKNAI